MVLQVRKNHNLFVGLNFCSFLYQNAGSASECEFSGRIHVLQIVPVLVSHLCGLICMCTEVNYRLQPLSAPSGQEYCLNNRNRKKLPKMVVKLEISREEMDYCFHFSFLRFWIL